MEENEQNDNIEDEENNHFSDSSGMSESEQRIRRASIRRILSDNGLTQIERNKLVQNLMDGRTRPSVANNYRNEFSSQGSFVFSDQEVRGRAQFPGIIDTGGNNFFAPNSSSFSSRQQSKRSFESMSDSSEMDTDESSSDTAKRIAFASVECPHYKRNCNIISPCCGMIFGCRFCHNDCNELPPRIDRTYSKPSSMKNPRHCLVVPESMYGSNDAQNVSTSSLNARMTSPVEETHHTLDRFAISEIVCKKCSTRQSSKTNSCINCNVQFGRYHCSICNLWMSDEEKPYHCHECGFCRIGGAENFRHCSRCGMCIAVSVFDKHDCKEGRYKSTCPICQEDLFSSRSLSHNMSCGHAIHWDCFQELIKFDYRCPVCKKTSDSYASMMHTWESMAVSVAMQPVPTELCRLVTIQCNDCEVKEQNRWWHVIGTQCKSCLSFNTNIETIQLTGQAARNYMGGEAESLKKEKEDAHELVLATGKWLLENAEQE